MSIPRKTRAFVSVSSAWPPLVLCTLANPFTYTGVLDSSSASPSFVLVIDGRSQLAIDPGVMWRLGEGYGSASPQPCGEIRTLFPSPILYKTSALLDARTINSMQFCLLRPLFF